MSLAVEAAAAAVAAGSAGAWVSRRARPAILAAVAGLWLRVSWWLGQMLWAESAAYYPAADPLLSLLRRLVLAGLLLVDFGLLGLVLVVVRQGRESRVGGAASEPPATAVPEVSGARGRDGK
ncbi:MAG: hypothetical protein HYV63_00725 [Candidatus Schekmanbacteria bacterium]|nr:hypothetical protein [Candidatus Schekmanbacteria bacterium]